MDSNSIKYIERYLEKMNKIQDEVLKVIDSQSDNESLENEIVYNLSKLKVVDNTDVFRSFLHLLSKVYENHHQRQDSLKLIENIITHYKKDILNTFQNCEIFTIFKNDKKLLLFLLTSEIIKLDNFVILALKSDSYSTFFYPEIKDHLEQSKKRDIESKITDDFLEKRQIGENHSYLCGLIRNDSADEFITYVSRTNLPLSSQIDESIYETNTFLIDKKKVTLIEYASYFGSIQIFQYLKTNQVKLTESIWLFAIHSQNSEILQILEENNVKPNRKKFAKFYNEAVKCHHNDIASYIYDNYNVNYEEEEEEFNEDSNNNNQNQFINLLQKLLLNKNEEEEYGDETAIPLIYFKSYNFAYIEIEQISYSMLTDLCELDYTFFVYRLMKTVTPDELNKKEIKKEEGRHKNYELIHDETPLSAAVRNDNNEVVKILLANDSVNVNYSYRSIVKIIFNKIVTFEAAVLSAVCLVSVLMPFLSSLFSVFPVIFLITLVDYMITKIKDAMGYSYSLRVLTRIINISVESCEYLLEDFTVLHIACHHDNTEIANLLLAKQEIDVNVVYVHSEYGTSQDTALTLALTNNNDEVVKNLLEFDDIDVNAVQKYSETRSLSISAKPIFNFTIDIPFSITFFMFVFCILLPILAFAFYQYTIVIGLILGVLFVVCYYLLPFIVRLILPVGLYATITYIIKKILHLINPVTILRFFKSIEKIGVFVAIPEYLSTLAFKTFAQKSPLHIAIENKNVENAKLLLSKESIDVNSIYKSCVYRYKDENGMEYLSYEEVHTNKTALNMAAEMNSEEIVALLLSNKNVDANATCKSSSCNRRRILSDLSIYTYGIESLICLFTASRSNKSTLEIAVENENAEIVQHLLENNKISDVKSEFDKLKGENVNKEILELLQKFSSDN